MINSRSAARRRLPLQAWMLEPRMMFDAAAVATAAEVVAATDTAPGVTASGADATITIDDNSDVQSVDLFSDVSVSKDGDGEELSSLVITVDSSGSNQALVIDGSTIVLETGSGETTTNGYYYQVSSSGGTTTITITIDSSDAYTASDVDSLIDGISYSTLDNAVESGTVTVTLSSLSDEGGDSATLDISSTITITSSVNAAPTLSDENALEAAESFTIDDLGDDVEVAYSADGSYVYAAGDGIVSAFSVDDNGRLTLIGTITVEGMNTATEMVVSSDGSSIYIIDTLGEDQYDYNTDYIYVLSVADDGSLSHVATVSTSNGGATGGLAISEDGAWLYVGTASNDVAIFSRDTTTGEITFLSRTEGEGGSNSRNGVIVVSGDYVYVIYTGSAHVIIAYQRNDDGTLSKVASLNTSATGYSAVDYSLAVSEDGQYLYVSSPDSDTIAVYQFSGSSLSLLETLTLDGVTDIVLSSDGSLLYAATSSGISVYAVSASGTLSLISSIASDAVSDLAVSDDGLSVLAAGSGGVTRYSAAQTLNQGEETAFASGVTLADSNFDTLNEGNGNYNGASISVSASVSGGDFGFADGDGLTYADGVISLDGSAIATLSVSEGVLTVTFTADTTTAVANQVLQQLTYANDSAAVGSYILLTIVASDGALSSSTVATLRVNAVPQVNTDVSAGYSLGTTTSETDYSYTLFSDLFSDADGDSLTWTVTGLPEGLTFDAETLTISGAALETGDFTVTVTVTDASGASASLDLSLTVEQVANRAPQTSEDAATTLENATEGADYSATLDSALFSDADSIYGDSLTWTVEGLPEGFTFDAETLTLSGSSTAVGDYTLTVTVTDESGASATIEMTLRVITTDEAANSAPSLDADDSSLVYTVDGNLTGFSQYVYDLELSDDDSTLIVVGNSTNSHAVTPSGNSTLYVYSRDSETGELTLVQTFVQGTSDDGDDSNGIEIDGLDSATTAVYSADNKYVYLVGKNASGSYVVTVLSVNDDGTLEATGLSVEVTDASQVKQMAVSSDGSSLYVLSANTLYAYTIGENGALTLAGTYSDSFNTASAIAIDESSGIVYVTGGSRIIIYTVSDDGSLTYATTYSGGSNFMRSIVVSDSGYVYVSAGANGIYVFSYDVDSNEMTQVARYSDGQLWGLTLSDDGTALYAGYLTGNIYVYTVNDDGTLTRSGTLSNSSARGFRYAISSDGSSIYFGGFYNSTGLNQISAGAVAATYSEAATAQLFTAITLSDADYDALNDGAGNYNGATISVAREDGADSADSYGFADGNGLTLEDGVLYLDGAAIATFASADGALTVTFTADVTTAVANLVLQQITYTNTSADPGASITLTVTVGDQYTTSAINVLLTVTEVNDAPTLESSATAATYVTGAGGVRLFSDTTISTVESDQTISSLTLTVSGVSDGASETLTLDGTAIALVEGSGTTSSGYGYSVTVDADTGLVTVTLSGSIAADAAAALIDAATYANSSDSPTGDARTVTLTAVQDSGGTSNEGSDTTALSIAATVALSSQNRAPTASSTTGNVAYSENGAAVSLFNGTEISTVEDGQTILSLTLTVSGVSDGENEVLTLDGTAIALVEGSGTTSSGYTYSVTVDADTGLVAVTVASSDGITADAAAALIDGATYANGSDDPSAGDRTVTLASIQDNGGTGNDGSDTASLSIAATVSVIAVNDAPTLTSTANSATYIESGNSASLFSDTHIDTVESGQTINAITLTISGVSDGESETLTIDGTVIALVAGEGVTDGGYAYTVTVDGDSGVVTVTFGSADGIAVDTAAALIDAMVYINSNSTYTAGERSFTLSVQDSGGADDDGIDTTTLADSAVLTLVANDAPLLGSTPDNEALEIIASMDSVAGLNDVVASVLSDDGSYLYVVSSDGSIAIFSRSADSGELVYLDTLDSGLDDVSDIQMSDDGGTVYVLGEGGDAIAIFSRASGDGTLTLTQTLVIENVTAFAVADDGSALYVVDGNYSGLLVYTLDGDSGQYVQTQKIAASTTSEPYLFTGVSIAVVGDYVYVVTDPVSDALADTLIVYQRDSDGTLSAVAYLQDGATDAAGNSVSLSDPQSITVSSDGGTLYVAGTDGVSIFSFDADSATLTYVGAISDLSGVTAIALASDDDSLYVTSSDGTISRYDVSGDEAVLLQTVASDSLSGVQDVAVAANGALVAVGTSGVVNLQDGLADSIALTYTEQGTQSIAGELTLSDADYDALNGGVGNYNGATISVVRADGADGDDGYGFADANGLTLSDGAIYYNGEAIATFDSSDGTLTIVFTGDVSTAVANQILQQITYTNLSDDPGSSVTLLLTVSDGYGVSDSVELALSVTEINDAPTLTSTAAEATYVEGAAALGLFSETAVSTVESGQTIVSLTLTVSGALDGASETLTIDGTAIALIAGSGTTASGYGYVVTVDGDSATIVIDSADGIAAADVAGLVDGIAYANSSDDPSEGVRTVTLTAIQDSGGSADDGADTTALAIAASVTVVGVNDAPELSATAISASYTAGDGAVSLFDGSAISTIENGQSIKTLTVTVSGVADDAESLIVDGTRVMLTDGTVTTANGLSVTVSLADGTATLVISSADGLSAADAAAVIDGLSYMNTSDVVTASVRTVTLVAVQDDGGTANDGADTTALSIAATVDILNSAPQATDVEIVLPEATQDEEYHAELSTDLFSDVNGDTLSWSVDGLPSGLSFNADTATISGRTLATGSFELTLTVSDGHGGTASRVVTLVVNEQQVSPVVLSATGALGMMERWLREQDDERQRRGQNAPFRPAAASFIASSHPAAATTAADGNALSRERYPLAGGAIDYAATPWQLDAVMTSLMPTLENVDFSSLRAAAVPAPDSDAAPSRTASSGDGYGKAAFSEQLQRERAAFDTLLGALNQLAENIAPPAE